MRKYKILFITIITLIFTLTACGTVSEEAISHTNLNVVEEVIFSEEAEDMEEIELAEEVVMKEEVVVVEGAIPSEEGIPTEEPIPIEESIPSEEPVVVEISNEELMEKVLELEWTQNLSQIMLVVGTRESRAKFLFIEKTEEEYEIVFSTLAWIGSNGMGKTMEGDCKTPAGVYTLSHPFGRNDDPGCQIPYVKLDDSWYWVEDGNSKYYNQMVTTNEVEMDWTEAEQLNKFGYSYNYSIAIDYNIERVPGVGSAIFLHCTHDSPTRGCVAIEEELMIETLQRVRDGAVIALYPDENSIN